jgi:hypothetical protein
MKWALLRALVGVSIGTSLLYAQYEPSTTLQASRPIPRVTVTASVPAKPIPYLAVTLAQYGPPPEMNPYFPGYRGEHMFRGDPLRGPQPWDREYNGQVDRYWNRQPPGGYPPGRAPSGPWRDY